MRAALALLCLAASGAAAAAAQVVDIAWTPEGRFTHMATLAPRELLEVCGKLHRGGRVAWSFEAGAPLPFNIHVHQGKAVVYPARLERATKAQGVQIFDAEPAHCWMWTNTAAEAVKVSVELQQTPR
ncbi:hypothetical protein ACG04Q_12710 [Roseateles sp. DXS20W]|uniref:Uncharacterized protein n=1 Tax=Pelomonas lactea TaxID=3299030 RepID=A0ABW7GKE4_9BURK